MKQVIYEMIIKEKLGKEFFYKSEMIRDTQCIICTKKKKKCCRLDICNNQCKNFKEVRKYESKSIS